LQRRLSYGAIPAPDIADVPAAPRQPFLGEDDVEVADAVVGCVAGSAAAVAMAFFLVVNDFRPIPVGVLSVLTGLIVGGAAVLWARRRLQRERTRGLEKRSEEHT